MTSNPFENDGRDTWTRASEGLDLLRLSMILSIITSVLFAVMGAKSSGFAILQLIVSLLMSIMTIVALGKWRAIPLESGGKGAASTAHVGAIISLIASLVVVFLAFGILSRGFSSRSGATITLVIAVVALAGSIMQVVGFLLSCRAVGNYFERSDIATSSMAVLVLGLITVIGYVLASTGIIGKRGGATGVLVIAAICALIGLIMFIILIGKLQSAIAERRAKLVETFT